jgi:hypothetical protein
MTPIDYNYRGELSEEEIKKLPLELKVCYMICPWNKSFNPKNIEEWAYYLGWHAFYRKGDETVADACKKAKIYAYKKLEFIRDFILIPFDLENFEPLNEEEKKAYREGLDQLFMPTGKNVFNFNRK